MKTWKNLTGISLFSNSYTPQNHLSRAEYARCVLSTARTAAFNANLVVFNCEAQGFRSHNEMVLSEGPTGRQLSSCHVTISFNFDFLHLNYSWNHQSRKSGDTIWHKETLLWAAKWVWSTGNDFLVDKYLCVWYPIVSTFRRQSFPAAFLHFLTKLSIRVCRYGAAPFAHQKVKWMIKSAFCLFALLGISHLFLADKRALIRRSQDAGVSASVVTGLVYRNHSFSAQLSDSVFIIQSLASPGKSTHRRLPLLVLPRLLTRTVNADVSPCFRSAWCRLQPQPQKRPNSPPSVTVQLVFSTMWTSPDADPLLAVKRIQMFSIMSLCSNWIMPCSLC